MAKKTMPPKKVAKMPMPMPYKKGGKVKGC